MNRLLRVALLAGVAGALGLAASSGFPLCPMAATFGLPCPGCGLTRATLALLHGHVAAALHFHPLVWLLSPLFVGFVGVALFEFLRPSPATPPPPRPLWNGRLANAGAALLLATTLTVWLVRFAGYLGGPVPVTSLREWLSARR